MSPTERIRRQARAPRLVVGCLVSLVSLLPATASAAPPTTSGLDPVPDQALEPELVLIRVAPEDPRLLARLEAELDISGLEVERLDWDQNVAIGPSLLDELEPRGASAAIEIFLRDDRAEVWVADATTGTALTRRHPRSSDAREQARTLAVGAVELLRASRLEYAEQHPELAETDPFVKQATESERPPEVEIDLEPNISLSLSPLVGSSPGGLGLTGHLEVATRWAVYRPLLLSFNLWVPVYGNQSHNEPGVSARSFITMAFVEPQWSPRIRRARWFHPTLGVGIGAAVLVTTGEVVLDGMAAPADPKLDVVAGFAADAHADLAFAVHPRVWLRFGGHVGIIQPAFRINLLDQQKTYGLPFAMGTLGLEFWI